MLGQLEKIPKPTFSFDLGLWTDPREPGNEKLETKDFSRTPQAMLLSSETSYRVCFDKNFQISRTFMQTFLTHTLATFFDLRATLRAVESFEVNFCCLPLICQQAQQVRLLPCVNRYFVCILTSNRVSWAGNHESSVTGEISWLSETNERK